MKIAVVGSREFFQDKIHKCIDIKNQNLITETLAKTFKDGDIFISGGAIGVDSWAELNIDEMNLGLKNPNKKIIFKPDWDKYGKRAGFLRNALIINEADKVLAFWDGKSKGTKHSIDLAIKAGKPVNIYVRQL